MKTFFLNNKYRIVEGLLIAIPSMLLISPYADTLVIILALLLALVLSKKETLKNSIRAICTNKTLYIVAILYIVFLVMHLLGLLYTDNYDIGLTIIRKRLALFILPVIFLCAHDKIKQRAIGRYLVFSVLAACVYTNINSLISLINSGDSLSLFYTKNLRFIYEKLMFYPIHPPYFGIFINIAIVNEFCQWKRRSSGKWISLVILLVLILNLYLVSSQMAIITFAILVGSLLLYSFYHRVNRLIYYITTLILLGALITVFFKGKKITETLIGAFKVESRNHVLQRINHFYEKGDLTRQRNWESGWAAFKEHPIIGTGTGDAIDEMLKYRHKKTWIYIKKANSHNQYIEESVRFGIIGVICLVGFFLVLGRALLFQKEYQYLAILGVLMMAMMTESILNRQIGIVICGFYVSLIFFIYLRNITRLS